MTRASGSGRYWQEAAAAEWLWAATLARDATRVAACTAELDAFHRVRPAGLPGTTVAAWFDRLDVALGLPVTSSKRESRDVLGDVSATLTNGAKVWFEVKYQSTKPSFSQITETDWVRGATLATAWLCANDAAVAAALPTALLADIARGPVPPGWGLSEVWLADMLLLTSTDQLTAANITTPADLVAFSKSK